MDQEPELCDACWTITGDALSGTRAFKAGTHHQHYNAAGDLEQDYRTPDVEGQYHTLCLEEPARTVQTCAACKLFHKAAHDGITLTGPTFLRLFLGDSREYLDFEDVTKVENESARAAKSGSVAELSGKGSLSIFTDHDSEAANSFPGRRVGEAGSDVSLAFAKRCLATCDAEHPSCSLGIMGNLLEDPPVMPTRVIFVGNQSTGWSLSLLETNGLRGRYIAVSHCWGTQVKPFTTKATLDYLQKHIDFDLLPKTFQDSIVVARNLGISYLWIDSLCIVQDHADDWEREAKGMGLVYERAYLTISASDALGDHAGFMIPHPQMEPDLRFPWRKGQPGSVYVRRFNYPRFDPGSTPLSKRGWVIQERKLSRRILHFEELQVHWECRQGVLGEDGRVQATSEHVNSAAALIRDIKPLTRPTTRKATRLASPTRAGEDDTNVHWRASLTLYNFFVSTFQAYSMCKLTLASDKLPALLGLANEVQRATGITFIDGHFLFDNRLLFISSLLWFAEGWTIFELPNGGRPDKTRAPSWSWAALEGGRFFHWYGADFDKPRRLMIKLDEVLKLDMGGLCPYNALVFTGRIVPALKSHSVTGVDNNSLGRRWGRRDPIKSPSPGNEILEPSQNGRPRTMNGEGKGWVCFDSWTYKPEEFLLVAICECKPGEYDNWMGDCRGCPVLVVEKVAVVEEPELVSQGTAYKRIGLGALKDSTMFDGCSEMRFTLI